MAAYDNDDKSLVEFQLGSKQLFLLFIGLLIICAIFFFIGLRVGEDTQKSKVNLTFNSDPQQNEAANADDGKVKTVQLNQGNEQPVQEQKSARLDLNQPAEKEAETTQKTNDKPVPRNRQAEKPAETKAAVVQQPKESQTKQPAVSNSNANSEIPSGYYVQVSAPRELKGAQNMLRTLPTPNLIQRAVVNGVTYFRVRIGPFADKASAEKARQGILGKHKDAIISHQK